MWITHMQDTLWPLCPSHRDPIITGYTLHWSYRVSSKTLCPW